MIAGLWQALLKAAPVRMWALILAGPPLTLTAIGLTFIVWKGGWPPALAAKQLDIIGWALGGNIVLLAVIIITLAAARVKAAGLGGTSIEIDADGQAPGQTISVSASASAAPAATPANTSGQEA